MSEADLLAQIGPHFWWFGGRDTVDHRPACAAF
jgi:hypothetical protein